MSNSNKITIPRDDLYRKYIVDNLSRSECAKYFNVTEKAVTRRLSEYGIKKDSSERYKNISKTIKERYGTDSTFASPEVRAKCRLTMLDRYGVEYTAQSTELQNKMQKTMLDKYGKKNYVETTEFQEKSSTTCFNKQNVQWPCQFKQCIEALESASGHSKPEQEFSKILEKYNISYEQEFPIRGFKYDFKVGDFLFEINPSGTHNTNFGLFGKEPRNKAYHLTKSIVANENGYKCIHIFDWDDAEKAVKLFLCPKNRIFARNCDVKEISRCEAVKFINENHLQGYAMDEIRIGLFHKGVLVSVMTFGKPRYNKNYALELIRYCTNSNVIGGAEKIFKYFVDNYKPKSIISYCDLSKFSGEVYHKLGFKALNNPKPSAHWYNMSTKCHITDNLLRQKGFDQLFKTDYGKGTSNEQLMLENGFVKIYDCGQRSYGLTF